MRPNCTDLIESWQRINDVAAKKLPASTEAAIQTHLQLFTGPDRKEAEERVRDIIRLSAFATDELRARSRRATVTLAAQIDSVGLREGFAC